MSGLSPSRRAPKRIDTPHRTSCRQIVLLRPRDVERRQQASKSKLLLPHLDNRRMKPITLRRSNHHPIRLNPSTQNLDCVSHTTCLLELGTLMLSKVELLIDRLPQLPPRDPQGLRHASHINTFFH